MGFLEWREGLNGSRIFDLWNKFGDVLGTELSHKTGGIYTWGQDSVDLTGEVPDVSSNSAQWEAFLFLKYVKIGRREGFETGSYEYPYKDDVDE